MTTAWCARVGLCAVIAVAVLSAAFYGCGGSTAPADRTNTEAKTGSDASYDAALPDSGTIMDAGGTDGGMMMDMGVDPDAGTDPDAAPGPAYVVLAWNNLGMHCYNNDAADLEVLPPYNTLWAQVVKTGEPPQYLSSGITVSYEFIDNSTSVGKTNFWDHAQQAYGLASPLPPDTGLKGKGLKGRFDWVDDHFIAEGIPLTEYHDSAPAVPDPFQQAVITVRDDATQQVLATATVVAPVSSEIHCDNCHMDDGDATTRYPITPTGKVETNILALHDYLNTGTYDPPLMSRRPVLCAGCHSSNALGTKGVAGARSLSNAMHFHHKDLPDITPDTAGCYNCHPGPETQCLRDTMSQNFSHNCTNCHGTMEKVAQNTDPWLNEPRCDNASCHGAGYTLDQPLYRDSKGHGETYCAACHDSPHAIGPSREAKDGEKFVAMQGSPGALRKCTVCHASTPADAFKHRASP